MRGGFFTKFAALVHGVPRETLKTPFPEVLVVFATPRLPEEYDLVFPEVPTTPRSPEKDIISNFFLFCSKIMN